MSNGLLLIWTDITPEAEIDFNNWYEQQHLEERVGVRGFLNGRRYQALDGRPKYLAWYETDSPEVLGSAEYGERQANPTEWTRRIMPCFRNVTRVTARQISKAGTGIGGWCTTHRFKPNSVANEALTSWLENAPHSLVDEGKAISAQTWHPTSIDSARGTTEAQLRKTEENPPVWGLLVETGSYEAAQKSTFGIAELIGSLGGGEIETGHYRLGLLRLPR
ncbi:MAG: hypothetical protein ACO21T_05545 [Alphaproteobacteria bacterium]|jgi:hypothetical protein